MLHTWTRALLWHPHVHCPVPAVAVESDGTWRRTSPDLLIHVKALSELFRGKFRDPETERLRTVRLTPFELIRRFLQHTPVRSFHRMRYYGFQARSNRSVLRTLQMQLEPGLGDLACQLAECAETCRERACYCPYCGSIMLVTVTVRRSDFLPARSRTPPTDRAAVSVSSP